MMKALVKAEAAPGIWMQDVDLPTIGPNDVLIKIKKTAICGTDVHIYQWDAWAQKNIPVPLVTGHEFIGEVVETGGAVKFLAIGDRVSGEGHIPCTQCRNCRTGLEHLCDSTIGLGVNRPGAFAEYLSLPAHNVIKVPDDISDEVASIFDPLGNAVHTVLSYPVAGEDVLITGAGPVGVMGAAIARQAGARNIIITDVNEERLAIAKSMGATLAVNVAKTSLDAALEAAQLPKQYRIGLEMSGNPQAFADLVHHMSPAGKIVLLGLVPAGAGIDWPDLIFKGLTIKGIYGREMFSTWYKMFHLLQAGLDVTPVITHHFPVDEYEKGFSIACEGNAGKVILDWS